MTTVFHQGLGFPEGYHKLRSALFIGGKEMQWTLGAMLYLTRFLPLRLVAIVRPSLRVAAGCYAVPHALSASTVSSDTPR